jgi:hypothetical protein
MQVEGKHVGRGRGETRARVILVALGLGYLSFSVALARVLYLLGCGRPIPIAAAGLVAGSFGLLAVAYSSSPSPRPAFRNVLLAPSPLIALLLAASLVHEAFVAPAGGSPPAALRLVATLLAPLTMPVLLHLFRSGFYSHRWVAR